MVVKQGFRTKEVVRLTGLSQRQLDYWDRTGMFKPSLAEAEGRGSARFYSFTDVVKLRLVKKLLDAGLPAKRLRRCLQFLRELTGEAIPVEATLVTDGKDIFWLSKESNIAFSTLYKGQTVWVVHVQQAMEKIVENG